MTLLVNIMASLTAFVDEIEMAQGESRSVYFL